MTWSFNLSFTFAFKKGNGVFCHFNFIWIHFSLKTEIRNRSSLVNGSKTGVIVILRNGNLTSMRNWGPFTQSFYKNHPCTFKSHSPGPSQIMMNILSMETVFKFTSILPGWFVKHHLYCLSILCIYVYINIFNYHILQYILLKYTFVHVG